MNEKLEKLNRQKTAAEIRKCCKSRKEASAHLLLLYSHGKNLIGHHKAEEPS